MVVLTMIVRNEAQVIARCLENVRPFIDRWCVVDTGSTDDTEAEIRRALEGIPGELHRIEWQGFGHARTEAFRRAGREGYALVIDADEVASGDPTLFRESLTTDSLGLWIELQGTRFRQLRVFDLQHGWRYEGVLHEFPTANTALTETDAQGLKLEPRGDNGNERALNPKKYLRDADVFERELLAEKNSPLASRYRFYLAQSYRDGGDDRQAALNYMRRAELGPGLNSDEIYISLLEAGRAFRRLGRDPVPIWLRAHEVAPMRAEVLHELASFHRLKNQFHLAYIFATAAARCALPTTGLFLEPASYVWRSLDELALAAFYTGRKEEAAAVTNRLLALPDLPPVDRERLATNLVFSLT